MPRFGALEVVVGDLALGGLVGLAAPHGLAVEVLAPRGRRTERDELEQARSTYDSVAQDSVTKQYAAAELRKAELALQKA